MAKEATSKPRPAAQSALAAHSGRKRFILFNEKTLHGKLAFQVDELVEFEDPAVAAYFDVAFNGTDLLASVPEGYKVSRVLTDEEINFDPDDPRENETIDPNTRIGTGRKDIEPGTTVFGHLTGVKGDGDAALRVKDVTGDQEVTGA